MYGKGSQSGWARNEYGYRLNIEASLTAKAPGRNGATDAAEGFLRVAWRPGVFAVKFKLYYYRHPITY